MRFAAAALVCCTPLPMGENARDSVPGGDLTCVILGLCFFHAKKEYFLGDVCFMFGV